MKTRIIVSVALAFSAGATGQEFTANHAFIASPDTNRVIELDSDMQFVRALQHPSMAVPHALAFGPDGSLYVGSATAEVFEFRGDGTSPRRFNVGIGPSGLQFAFGGLLLRSGDGTVTTFDVYQASPNSGGIFFLGGTVEGLAMGADGRLYVASPERDAVVRMEPDAFEAGQFDVVFPSDTLELPQDVAIGRRGRIWVSDRIGDDIHEFTPAGLHVNTISIPGLPDPDGMTFGPDGKLWVTSNFSTNIARVDPESKQFTLFDLEDFGALHPADIAFAPTRFTAKIQGKVTDLEGNNVKVKESAIVSWAPGSRCWMIELTELGDESLRGIFFDDAWVLYGHEYGEGLDKKRSLTMSMEHSFSQQNGAIGASLKAKGVVSAGGVYEPLSLAGTIERADPSKQFVGKVSTKTRIN